MTDPAGVSTTLLLAGAGGLLFGGLVKGATGLGLPTFAVPVMVTFIPLPQAMALVAFSSLATSMWQAVEGGLFFKALRRLAPLIVTMALGVAAGAGALALVAPRTVTLIIGAIVVAYALLFFARVTFTIPPQAERWAGPLAGLTVGAIGGASMIFGPLYAVYFAALRVPKDLFVVAVSICNLFGTVFVVVALAGYSLVNTADLGLSLVAAVPSFAGLWLGRRLRGRLNERSFARVLAFVLLAVGLILLRKAFA